MYLVKYDNFVGEKIFSGHFLADSYDDVHTKFLEFYYDDVPEFEHLKSYVYFDVTISNIVINEISDSDAEVLDRLCL